MNALSDYLLTWFADYYLLSTLLLGAALLVGACMRQPARRIAVAWAAVIGLAMLGGLLAVPGWSVVHLFGTSPPPPEPSEIAVEMVLPASSVPTVVYQQPPTELQVLPPYSPTQPVQQGIAKVTPVPAEVREVNVSVYFLFPLAIGSAIALAWLGLGAWQTYRLVSNSAPSTPEVDSILRTLAPANETRPLVRLSHWVATGVALGLMRPTILLPQAYADREDATSLRTVLAHELAHLRGGDLWLLAVLRVLMIALWAHPLYWLTRRRIRLDQETLADAAAAELTSRTTYAEQLVGWARELDAVRPPTLAGAVGLWETKSQLRKRIAVLLDERLTILRDCSRKWKLSALVLCGAAALGLSLLTMEPGKAGADEQAPTANEEEAAEDGAPADFEKFGPAVGHEVAEVIRRANLPFIDDERLQEIEEDFTHFVDAQLQLGEFTTAESLPEEERERILSAIRQHGAKHLNIDRFQQGNLRSLNLAYLGLPDRLLTLKWKLHLAFSNSEKLSREGQAVLDAQRLWMQAYIKTLPLYRAFTIRSALAELKERFADPLCCTLGYPMTDDQFDNFQQQLQEYPTKSELAYVVSHIVQQSLYARYRDFNEFPIPFDDRVVGYGAGRFVHLNFESNRPFVGSMKSLGDIETSATLVDATTGNLLTIPEHSRKPGKFQKWVEEKEQGDFGYDSAHNGGLFGMRGTQLAKLPVNTWVEADAITNDQLRTMLNGREAGRVVPLKKHYQDYQNDNGAPYCYVGVLTNEGRLAVVAVEDFSGRSIGVRTRVRPAGADTETTTSRADSKDTQRDGLIEGRVVDGEGQPVARAEVGLVHDEGKPNEPPTFVATSTTDDQGEFALPYPESDLRTFMSVWAVADDFGPARIPTSTVAGALDQRDNATVQLSQVDDTTVKLVDAEQQPIEGVDVSALAIRVPRSVGWAVPVDWRGRFTGTTNTDGLARVRGVLPDSFSEMQVESDAIGRVHFNQNAFLNMRPESESPHFTICIPPTVRVRGRVLTDDEDAVLPQTVHLKTELWPGSKNNLPEWAHCAGMWGVAEVSPNDKGYFVVPRIAAGVLHVEAGMPSGQPWRTVVPQPTRISAGDRHNVDIQVTRGVKIRGRVVKQDTGEGYPGFRLSVKQAPSKNAMRSAAIAVKVETDADGWYEATMPLGWVCLRLHSAPRDYHDVDYFRPKGEALKDPREIPAGANEFTLPDVELVPTTQVNGQLVDKNDRPLGGWVVYGYPDLDNNAMNSFAGVHTNQNGEFSGHVAETLIPKLWKVSFRDWSDVYDFEDKDYFPKITSEQPLVLKVDVDGRANTRAENTGAGDANIMPKGLEFLAGIPEFAELRLEMTEEQLKEIIDRHELDVQTSRNDEENTSSYTLTTLTGKTVIVMFGDGKCGGIQRMRDQLAWGEALDGVRIALSPKQSLAWLIDQPLRPILTPLVTQEGRHSLLLSTAQMPESRLKVDGIFYRHPGEDITGVAYHPSSFWVAQAGAGPKIVLDDQWRSVEGNQQLHMKAGTHRVSYGWAGFHPSKENAKKPDEDRPVLLWSGEVEVEVKFDETTVDGNSRSTNVEGNTEGVADIVWGEVVDGLQAGLASAHPEGSYKIGQDVPLRFLVRNTSNKPITFTHQRVPVFINWDNYRNTPGTQLFGPHGQVFPASGVGGQGMPGEITRTVKPGQIISMASVRLPLRPEGWKGTTVNVLTYCVNPGKHRVALSHNINGKIVTSGMLGLDVHSSDQAVPPLTAPWGDANEGIRCRLHANEMVIQQAEPLILFVDLQNRGSETVEQLWHALEFKLEVDGKWTGRLSPVEASGPVSPLKPGQEWINIPIVLEEGQYSMAKTATTPGGEANFSKLLVPGKHKVRVDVDGVISQPIEVEIATGGTDSKPQRANNELVGQWVGGGGIMQVYHTFDADGGYERRIGNEPPERGTWRLENNRLTRQIAGQEQATHQIKWVNPDVFRVDAPNGNSSGYYRIDEQTGRVILSGEAVDDGQTVEALLGDPNHNSIPGLSARLRLVSTEEPVRISDLVHYELVVKNETDEPIEFDWVTGSMWQPVVDQQARRIKLMGMFVGSGRAEMQHVVVPPKREKVLHHIRHRVQAKNSAIGGLPTPLFVDAGEYQVTAVGVWGSTPAMNLTVLPAARLQFRMQMPQGAKPREDQADRVTWNDGNGEQETLTLYREVHLDEDDVLLATLTSDGDSFGIDLDFAKQGAQKMRAITKPAAADGRRLVISLDGEVIAAPVVRSTIANKCSISSLKPGEAQQLHQAILTTLTRRLSETNEEHRRLSPPNGIYRVRPEDSDEPGIAMQRSDADGTVVLLNQLTDQFGQVEMKSMANDNTRFRVYLNGAGPFGKGDDIGRFALVVDGACVMIWGHSDPDKQGRMDLSAEVASVKAAHKIAAGLGIEPRLREHPGHQMEVSFTPTVKAFHPGEPVILTMEVKNSGDQPFSFYDGRKQRGARNNQFGFNAFRDAGNGPEVPDTGDANHRGGKASLKTLVPGDVFRKEVDITKWFDLSRPDTYKINGRFEIELHEPNADERFVLWDDVARGDCIVVIESKQSVPATVREEAKPEPPRTDFTIVIAKNLMLLDGTEFITWQDLEDRIAKLPDPSKARLNYRITHAASDGIGRKIQRAEHTRLEKKFGFDGYSIGGMSARGSHRFDSLKTAADLVRNPEHAASGRVVGTDGEPVAGAEVVFAKPVDDSVGYKGLDVYFQDGKLTNHLSDFVAVSNADGGFIIYPDSDELRYYLLVLHSEHGFALAKRHGRDLSEPIQLEPWASIKSNILPQEGMEQSASLSTRIAEGDGWPEVSINTQVPDRRPKPKAGEFNFPCVPPNLKSYYRRGIIKADGMSISLPTKEFTLKPGEELELTLGGLTPDEVDRLELHERLMERRQPSSAKEVTAASRARKNPDAIISAKVVDAETGEPIDKFIALAGTNRMEGYGWQWQTHTIAEYTNGELVWPPKGRRGYPTQVFRIEAEGYLPFTTDVVLRDAPRRDLTIRLQSSDDIAGTVSDPDGNPATDAKVAVAMCRREVRISDGSIKIKSLAPDASLRDRWEQPRTTTTNDDGAFTLPDESAPALLVVTHPTGVAMLNLEYVRDHPSIQLEPWGKIEGQVLWGGKPGAGESITMSARGRRDPDGLQTMLMVSCGGDATTDDDGKFVFDMVPPGVVQVSRQSEPHGESKIRTLRPVQFANVLPGVPTSMVFGGGRPVVGKLVGRDDWSDVRIRIAPNAPRPGDMGTPYDPWPAYTAFLASEAGKNYVKNNVVVNADGTFRIEDVPPENYQMFISHVPADGKAERIGYSAIRVETVLPGEEDKPLEIQEITVSRTR